ncbi:MAG TPA: peptidase dimerization domain protein, partial [Chitinophagaceae bacterium]|nr:peptidase dimerization domain protein [Chitinophagaceae bacterium]
NVKFLIEGEEEIGSSNLETFINLNTELLKCDAVLVSDTSLYAPGVPTLTYGLRGLCYMEVEVTGPNRFLHSGTFGGAVGNPINILAAMIAKLQDKDGRITIPGFYDDVLNVPDEERKLINKAPFNEKEYKDEIGIKALWGEKGFTTYERTGIRPTLELNGIWGGYTGEGAKTVLPAKATAKISARLVPNQTSAKMTKLLLDHFRKIAPSCVSVNVFEHHGGEAYMTPISSKGYKAASKALETTFGKTPIPVRGGGSIPICYTLEKELGIKIIFMGFGLDNDGLHSPNEKYNVENFYKGIETIPYFHKFFAEMS